MLSVTLAAISKLTEPLSRNCDSNMAQNEHIGAICRLPEVADDVIFGENVQTLENYVVVNFEFARYSSFQDIKKK